MAYILTAVFLILVFSGCWKLFEKAGRKGWEALIPVYSLYVMLKLSGRPIWWLLWLLMPVLNVVAVVIIYIDFLRSYGKLSFKQLAAGIFLPFIYLPKWGFGNTLYLGRFATIDFWKANAARLKKSITRLWVEALILAIAAATCFRIFIAEPYVIPSASMESSVLVGDYIYVNKLSYGPRIPVSPIAFPFAGNALPMFYVNSYWDGFLLPYLRLPGFEKISNGDVVVFNYPMDADPPFNRPVDRRDDYIKRCEGKPGDTVSFVNGEAFINGKHQPNPVNEQRSYLVHTDRTAIQAEILNALHIDSRPIPTKDSYLMLMTAQSESLVKHNAHIKSITEDLRAPGANNPLVFPHDSHYKWNEDNFGPLIIPKKGWTVKLDSLTIPLYERAMEVYENNKVTVSGNAITINGKQASSYTFKLNYYWMVGDNRHNSIDSRFWGLVPEDHIEGKAAFVWMSTDDSRPFLKQTRWSRILKPIR